MTTATTNTDAKESTATTGSAGGGDTGSSSSSSSDTQTTGSDTDAGKDWRTEAEKWKELARKHEERAKANAAASKELETLREKSMSEQEKAVAQAKRDGYAEGLAAGSSKVAAAELRAAAAGRMTEAQVEALLEATNLAAFLGEDGEVDRTKVTKFVDGIAPKAAETEEDAGAGSRPPRRPDLGQGARGGGSNTALNGDPLLRDLKAKLGIR